MRIIRQRSTRRVTNAPRHPEVNQERATGFESKNQILAASLDSRDVLAFELRCHGRRIKWAGESRITNPDALEPSTREHRGETLPHRLDLGKLGHIGSVA